MSNILVYSGPGVSNSALSHTLRALQSLCPTYDVRPTSAEELALAPWQETASLVVIPGGRDLPYVEEWSKPRSREDHGQSSTTATSSSHTAQDVVRKWVTDDGGAFVGICAGAYFASGSCTFERGTSMEVVGPRGGLKFFPGECRGTVYKGFVYESDEGARVVRLDTPSEGKLPMHYNGGGAFIDADKVPGVEILATYPLDDPDVARMEGVSTRTYAGQAAIVLCHTGKGKALLFGTHPEFSLLPGSRPVRLSGAPNTLFDSSVSNGQGESEDGDGDKGMMEAEQLADDHRSQLMRADFERRRYFGQCLANLGLRVVIPQGTRPQPLSQTQPSAVPSSSELAAQGRLSPLYLIAASEERFEQIVQAVKSASVGTTPASERSLHLAHSSIESSLLEDISAGYLTSVRDSNDIFHWYKADSKAAHAAILVCEEGAYTVEKEAGDNVDLHKVPKYVIGSSLAASSPLRHWDSSLYFTCLAQARSSVNQALVEEIGSVIQYGERVTSTQTMLDKNPRLMNLLPSGFTSFATHQISGRGRGGNAWISPLGCLQFSTLLHIPSTNDFPQGYEHNLGSTPMSVGPKLVFVQYIAGIAIVQAVRSGLGPEYAEVGRKVRLKWPNDIYAEIEEASGKEERKGVFKHLGKSWAKMGGILVNSQYDRGGWSLVVGCGVNTLNPLPTTSLSALIDEYNSKHASSSPLPHISQERLAATILTSFSRLWSHFLTHGGWSSTLASLYRESWLHSDQITTLTTLDPPISVRIIGISSDTGTLRAVDVSSGGTGGGGGRWSSDVTSEDDEIAWGPSSASLHLQRRGFNRNQEAEGIIELQPDGNSFDMLKNLIKVKE